MQPAGVDRGLEVIACDLRLLVAELELLQPPCRGLACCWDRAFVRLAWSLRSSAVKRV